MADMLTIAEIVRRTGIDRSVLNRYLSDPATRDIFQGAATHPLYPADAIPLFMRLAEQHSKGIVTPKTLKAAWANQLGDGEALPAVVRNAGSVRVPNSETPVPITAGSKWGAFHVIVGRDDRLLDRQEAARLLCCKPRSVGRYVKSVRRGVWRKSDILRYIAQL